MSVQWERTPDRSTWRAASGGRLLTVTRTTNGKWRAVVDDARSPEFATRLLAQKWAENQAGAQQPATRSLQVP